MVCRLKFLKSIAGISVMEESRRRSSLGANVLQKATAAKAALKELVSNGCLDLACFSISLEFSPRESMND